MNGAPWCVRNRSPARRLTRRGAEWTGLVAVIVTGTRRACAERTQDDDAADAFRRIVRAPFRRVSTNLATGLPITPSMIYCCTTDRTAASAF